MFQQLSCIWIKIKGERKTNKKRRKIKFRNNIANGQETPTRKRKAEICVFVTANQIEIKQKKTTTSKTLLKAATTLQFFFCFWNIRRKKTFENFSKYFLLSERHHYGTHTVIECSVNSFHSYGLCCRVWSCITSNNNTNNAHFRLDQACVWAFTVS